ncbi:purine-nucleoside phosphorylase [Acinetobacter baumannii]|nr:purine-nucleoside phosphorylase [Acinetobacter baumannii]
MLLISACLIGEPVRYDGRSCLHTTLKKLFLNKKAHALCPELLGGFTTPRLPAEIVGGTGQDVLDGKAKILDSSGLDVTELYLKGAYRTLDIARQIQATCVVLKENSPSCGSQKIYNGTFQGEKITGVGITTALLQRHGFEVISENEIEEWLAARPLC